MPLALATGGALAVQGTLTPAGPGDLEDRFALQLGDPAAAATSDGGAGPTHQLAVELTPAPTLATTVLIRDAAGKLLATSTAAGGQRHGFPNLATGASGQFEITVKRAGKAGAKPEDGGYALVLRSSPLGPGDEHEPNEDPATATAHRRRPHRTAGGRLPGHARRPGRVPHPAGRGGGGQRGSPGSRHPARGGGLAGGAGRAGQAPGRREGPQGRAPGPAQPGAAAPGGRRRRPGGRRLLPRPGARRGAGRRQPAVRAGRAQRARRRSRARAQRRRRPADRRWCRRPRGTSSPATWTPTASRPRRRRRCWSCNRRPGSTCRSRWPRPAAAGPGSSAPAAGSPSEPRWPRARRCCCGWWASGRPTGSWTPPTG